MRLPRFRLATLMLWGISFAFVLALIAQDRAASRREQALKTRLAQALRNQYAQEGMNRFLTDPGIDILKGASGVELLWVPSAAQLRKTGQDGVIPSGQYLPDGIASRLVGVLLDHRNYGYLGTFDDPIPQFGLRFKRGEESLDILISLENSRPNSHQDVWVNIRDKSGKVVHYAGPNCWHDAAFQSLVGELRAAGFPIP